MPGQSSSSAMCRRPSPPCWPSSGATSAGRAAPCRRCAQSAQHQPADLTEYRLGRIAEWSQPRYRLDGRFVALTLLVDQGEESASGRWAAKQERYDDLGALLAGVPDPAVVVLGPPGSGKSTLLRHLELDVGDRQPAGRGCARHRHLLHPVEPVQARASRAIRCRRRSGGWQAGGRPPIPTCRRWKPFSPQGRMILLWTP